MNQGPESEIEHIVDTRGVSYEMARRIVEGTTIVDPKDESVQLPGTPLPARRSVYVRDFADGGRADEHRGGDWGAHSTPEGLRALEVVMPTLYEVRDQLAADKINDSLAKNHIDNDGARRLIGVYLQKHKRDITPRIQFKT